jgi:flagellar biosynthesis protein FlhF
MRIKSFIASTVQEALASVRREMGDSSIILETRNIEEGDIKSRCGQTLVEVVAAENVNAKVEVEEKEDNEDEDEGQGQDQDKNQDHDEVQEQDINDDNDLQCENSNLNSEPPSQQTSDSIPAIQNFPVENLRVLDQIGSEIENITLADRLQAEDVIEMAGYRVDQSPVKIIDKKSCDFNDNWPVRSKEIYKQLREQQVEKNHSRILINEALCGLSKDDYDRVDLQRIMVKECIIKKVKYNCINTKDECKTMVFMGSAGSGKTTTISKLATEMKKGSNKDILFISIRGNSVEKLKKTAYLIGATVKTVTTQQELREIIETHGGGSHILIDTPSINNFCDNTLTIIEGYLDEISNLEIHLVVSATTRYVDIINIIKKATAFPIHRLLFTKIDETNLYGTLFSAAMETQIPLSYITDGHDIPDDISPVTAKMVAEMVLQV